MPANTYRQCCLTCGHAIDPAADNVTLIKMSNQPRYYHTDYTGCQEAERGNYPFSDIKAREESWTEVYSEQRRKTEREDMVTAE